MIDKTELDPEGMALCLDQGIRLVHQLLTDTSIPETLRLQLAEWRDEAERFLE
jgi:hypothetical protein